MNLATPIIAAGALDERISIIRLWRDGPLTGRLEGALCLLLRIVCSKETVLNPIIASLSFKGYKDSQQALQEVI